MRNSQVHRRTEDWAATTVIIVGETMGENSRSTMGEISQTRHCAGPGNFSVFMKQSFSFAAWEGSEWHPFDFGGQLCARSACLVDQSGLTHARSGKSGCIRLPDAWYVKARLDYTSPTSH